jgi:hypothetical protein
MDMDEFSNLAQNKNNIDNNNQPLVSLVNLISNNLNNVNKSNNETSSLFSNHNNNINSNGNNDNNTSKKNTNNNDDLLLEIDQIIGKDDINNALPITPSESNNINNNSETTNLNTNKSSFNKVEIKENHFVKKTESNYVKSYLSPFEFSEETLNEPILTTIYRDLYLIYTKLKFVINPYTSNEIKAYHIKQWDLWGPLLLIIFLAGTLAINSNDRSQTVILIFLIFWLGSFLVFLNAHLLGVKTSIFQIFCLLGYCLFPLNLSAFVLSFTKFLDIIRFFVVGITCFWSLYSVSSFLKNLAIPEQRYLVLYPSILLYIYISWFVFVTKH